MRVSVSVVSVSVMAAAGSEFSVEALAAFRVLPLDKLG